MKPLTASIGYYISFLTLENGDLAIVANHNLMQEWHNFQKTGQYENTRGSKPLPEDERTPRNLKLSALHGGSLTIESLLADFDEFARMSDGDGFQVLSGHDVADIGALTSAPIIALGVERYDDQRVKDCDTIWWFPNYQVEDELETLLEKGVVVFDKSKKAQ